MSHKLPAVVTGIIKWLRGIYSELWISMGKKHDHLGMDLNYSTPCRVVFSMEKYKRNVIAEFPEGLGKTADTPAAKYLFTVQEDSSRQMFPEEKVQVFHPTVAQLLFLMTRSCPDAKTALAFLTSRVNDPG